MCESGVGFGELIIPKRYWLTGIPCLANFKRQWKFAQERHPETVGLSPHTPVAKDMAFVPAIGAMEHAPQPRAAPVHSSNEYHLFSLYSVNKLDPWL